MLSEEVLQEVRFQQRPEVLSVETFQELCREVKAFLEQKS
jgi:hypothetical protein